MAIALNNPSLIRRGFLSLKAPLIVEIPLGSACRVYVQSWVFIPMIFISEQQKTNIKSIG